ncbi:MFS transporter [Polymorphobacter arshaanensis]|uniref:MFS transporter n=2 Tax=Glacieibacterium arshaanense TaxID=2511025 RepID=A0A4Y9EP77_9SPHN|nr:MFS transporter [Polymorphobacter arshaanensis]
MRIAYGLGSVASGVKDNGFGFLLLLFYSQVIGVDARLVGLAITLGLIVDALIDPVVGYYSDNLHSRWGRRHPLMYAAVIPVAGLYFMLWNPPHGWSDMALFGYLLGLSTLIRVAFSFYEIPSSALAPELTDDYDARSSLLSLRTFFGWVGGILIAVLLFGAIFPAFSTPAVPNGQFNRDAYRLYGIVASVVLFVAILVCALGTHRRIPILKSPPPARQRTLRVIFSEIFETLSNRSFFALFATSAFGLIAGGVSASLSNYISIYFWGFSSQQIALLTFSLLLSAVVGGILAPVATRRMGKRRGALIIGLLAVLGAPLPIFLRLIGLLPPGNVGWVYWFVLTASVIDVGLIIAFQILAASMMADLVEQSELQTGRRSEGLFVSSTTLLGKLVSGLGVTIASFVLTIAGLKAGADPTQVSPEAIWRLGALYVPAVLSFWLAMIFALSFYKLTRSDHEANLAALAARRLLD